MVAEEEEFDVMVGDRSPSPGPGEAGEVEVAGSGLPLSSPGPGEAGEAGAIGQGTRMVVDDEAGEPRPPTPMDDAEDGVAFDMLLALGSATMVRSEGGPPEK